MGKLDGKVALVTGSGRNIGRATILKMAAEGANVVVNARSNQAEADAVAEEARAMGVKAMAILADVSNKEQVDSMVSMAMAEFGKIDILVNNAAIRPHKPFLEVTLEDWEYVRGVVLDGAFTLPAPSCHQWSRTSTGASSSLLVMEPSKDHRSEPTFPPPRWG